MAYSKLKASYGQLQDPTLQGLANYTTPQGPANSAYNPQSTDPFVAAAQQQLNAPPTSLSTPTTNGAAVAQAGQGALIGGLTQPQVTQLTGLSQDQIAQAEQTPGGGAQLLGLISSARTGQNNTGILNGLSTQNALNDSKNAPYLQQIQNAANNQSGLVNGVDQGYGGLLGYQSGLTQTANAQNDASLAGYGSALQLGVGTELGAYGTLANQYGQMSQLAPTAFNSNVQAQDYAAQLAGYQGYQAQDANYQTAAAQLSDYQTYQAQLANYQTYQAQQAALAQAQLSQATSNPDDVGAEKGALSQLSGMATGSNDVRNGQLSPEANAAQISALQQYGALTTPEATAQEKFLYEQQREAQEQQEAASRAALMSQYRAKGVGGSGMELGSILQAGQQNSQQRLLGDLGTQAGAVNRSMTALAGYGNLSTQMQQQGNQIAQGNQATRAGAATAQGQLASNIRGQSDTMGMFNAGQANNVNVANAGFANQNSMFNANAVNDASQFNANAYNQNSMFNANASNTANQFNANAYNANSINNSQLVTQNNEFNANAYNSNQQFNANANNTASAFNANAYNSNQQFNANATNTANQFNAGQNNTVNMFNSQQNQIQSQFMDNYRATQQNDAAQRDGTLAGIGMTAGADVVDAGTKAFQAQTGVTGAEYQRGQDTTALGIGALTADYNARTSGNQAQTGAAQTWIGQNNQSLGNSIAIGTGLVGSNNTTSTNLASGYGGLAGTAASKAATDAATKAANEDPGGLLGTGILGKNGIIGLKGVPIL